MAIVKITLNSANWKYKCDTQQCGGSENWHEPVFIEQNFGNLSSCRLPQCFNTLREDKILPYDRFEGVFWFFRKFKFDGKIEHGEECFLRFNGVNYYCRVWVNGKYLGDHEGGFLPFQLRVPSEILGRNNYIAVQVENLRKYDRIPSLAYDWHNWGGIYRDIDFLVVPEKRILWVHIDTEQVAPDSAELVVTYKMNHGIAFIWQIVEGTESILEGRAAAHTGRGRFTLTIRNPKLWSPKTPHLYEFRARITKEGEPFRAKFGIRRIEVRSTGIYLNNERISIQGISLHEELMPYGRTINETERLKDLRTIKKLGFNTVRAAHYPHDEKLVELADEIGLMVLEEIPVYWHCDFANASVQRLAATMLRDLIYRDFNHPSVILWSIGNEVPIENRVCRRFMSQLLRFTKKLDPSRIATYASSRMFSDPIRTRVDLPCLNEYFGWYYFSERNLNFILDIIHEGTVSRPLLITEFGADAKFGFHSKNLQKSSEERQASILSHSIETFNSKEYVAGWIIWLYRDFRSPLRTNKYQQGYNRKGIVSETNQLKTIAKIIRSVSPTSPRKRRFRVLPKFGLIPRFIELFAVGIMFNLGQKLFSTRKSDRYYSRTPTYSKKSRT